MASKSRFGHLTLATSGPEDCAISGNNLLRSPYFNRGSAFTNEERTEFELHGLLPSRVQTLEEQIDRAYQQYSNKSDALAKNTFMTSMKEQNEVLYYALLQSHIKEMFGIIYTPTEGEAIERYSRLFRKPAGCFLNILQPHAIDDILSKWGDADDIDLIVVTDGEQILGIGDQGVGGILISIAKLAIYTLCAGIHPQRVLPISLDCGTDNQKHLEDELYLGLRQPRVRGKQYDDFVDKFVHAVRARFSKALLHFEDFGRSHASSILQRYSGTYPVFNDDIQGTGCVTLAALQAAVKVSNIKLRDIRVVCFGAGSAGVGIADQIAKAIALDSGKSVEEARKQFWLVDKQGLLLESQDQDLTDGERPFARKDSEWQSKKPDSLLHIIREVKPHALIGTSTQSKAFSEEVVKEMASHVKEPVIFPLSNPTRLAEAEPEDINTWSEGRALIATGSPFPPVKWEGVEYEVAECNNSTMFPGIGLGAVLSRAKLVTDKMLVAATTALAAESPALKDSKAGLLPDVTDVRRISVKIAAAVIKQAVKEELNQQKDIPSNDKDLEEWISEQMWDAKYRPLNKVSREEASKHAKGEAGVQASN